MTHEVNAVAVDTDARRRARRRSPRAMFQASTSEVYGPGAPNPQNESTPHDPRNPYAESKSRAHLATVEHRERQGVFACVGILYNHESPLRGTEFVTRRITRAAAEIAAGRRERVTLGNLEAARDWGAARDYVGAMHAALQHDEPGDYTIATGRLHTLRELLESRSPPPVSTTPGRGSSKIPSHAAGRFAGPVGDPRAHGRCLGGAHHVIRGLVPEMVRVDELRVRTGVEESEEYLTVGATDA